MDRKEGLASVRPSVLRGRVLGDSEVARELALFTAVEGGVVEEGAGGAAPLSPLVLVLV